MKIGSFWSVICVSIVWVIMSHGTFAQVVPQIQNYRYDAYGGGTQNWAGVQDSLGLLYIANGSNDSGILQFDGNTWRQINTNNVPMVSLEIGDRGRIFAGGQYEFGYLEADSTGALRYHSLVPLLPDSLKDFGIIWQTHFLEGKAYFNNGGSHIFIWEEGKPFQVIRPTNDFHRTYKVNGEIWVRDVKRALMRIKGTTLEPLPNTQEISAASIANIVPFDGERVLMTTQWSQAHHETITVYHPATGAIQQLAQEVAQEIGEATPYGVKTLSGNRFMVNTLRNGLFILAQDGSLLQHITRDEGLQDNMVLYAFEDNQRNIWACLNDGISRIMASDPFMLAPEGETFEGGIEDITTYQGKLFLSTQQGVFAQIPDTSKTSLNENFTFRQITNMISVQCWRFQHAFGELLIGTGERGIYTIDADRFEAQNIIDFSVYDMHPFTYNNRQLLLAGGRQGLILLEKDKVGWDTLWTDTQLKKSIVTGLHRAATPENSAFLLWISLEESQGVRYIQTDIEALIKGEFTVEKPANLEEFPDGFVYSNKVGNQIYFMPDSGIYTPAFSGNANLIKAVEGFDELAPYALRGIYEDKEGDFWAISRNQRVFHCLPRRGGIMQCDSTAMLSLDVGNLANMFFQEGVCWLAGTDALVRFQKSLEKNYRTSYATLVRSVQTENDSVIFAGNRSLRVPHVPPVLPFESNALTFYYATPFFEDAEDVVYSHRLLGDKDTWSKWKKEPKTVYTNLWEGDYIFEVKARNVFGQESTIGQYAFTVLPPLYRTYQAYSAYFIAIVVLVWGIVRLNTNRLKAEKQRLERLVKIRTKEIEEQNEEIRAKNSELELQKEEISTQAENLRKANDKISKANTALEKSQKAIQEQNDKITSSITYAKRIQEAILPSRILMQRYLPESFILFKPRDIVSGDFYWYAHVETTEGKPVSVVAAVDCTGHGVPGAFMSMLGDAYLNQIVQVQGITEPAQILFALNEYVRDALRQSTNQNRDGMDMALCTIHHTENRLEFAGARNPIIYVKNGELHRIKGDNFSVAGRMKQHEARYTTHSVQIDAPIAVYLYSDGYQDQFGGKNGKKFMTRQFRELLYKVHEHDAATQHKLLEETLHQWMHPAEGVHHEQVDDIMVIGLILSPNA